MQNQLQNNTKSCVCRLKHECRSKKRFQCNAVSFSTNAHETRVQHHRTTSQTVRIPFRFILFRLPRIVKVLLFMSKACIAGAPVAS